MAFSDTTTVHQRLPKEWDQAEALAKRLGVSPQPHPGDWRNLLFSAMHQVLDRLERLEAGRDAGT